MSKAYLSLSSGNPAPSKNDDFTNRMQSACEIIDISLLDHIIVTDTNRYYS
ncbi:JAB domain-containing protein [Enterococcus hirae]|uniref:JAB domain-containing protein n=1 Tax=Enterococcus hirae TaxID=1354 RepID=UPI001CECDC2F|nr:JAB domain-containing protein [Enterococcus hirae]